jgi:membrane protein
LWRKLAERTVAEVLDDGCTHMAAAIAYYALLSIFPLLILLVSVASLLMQHGEAAHRIADAVASTFPVAGPSISRMLQHVPAAGASGVGLASLIGLVWSASGVFGAMRSGINQAFDVQSVRPLVQGKLVDFAMAAGMGLFLLASTAAVSVLHVLREVATAIPAVGRGLASSEALWTAGSVAVGLLLAVILVTVLYWLIPARRRRLRDVWPGIVVGTLLLQATQYVFALYVGTVSHYNAVYGSLGTIVAFMVWVYLAALALLVGAEVASEYPRVRDAPPERVPVKREKHPQWRWARRLLMSLVKH